MPELPEVETIVRALQSGGRGEPPVTGLTFSGAEILWKRSIASPAAEGFDKQIQGQTIHQVRRRGKFIVFDLNSSALLVHLRMSGDLRVEPAFDQNGSPQPLHKHDRVVLGFSNALRLAFMDARKFGRLWLVGDAAEVTAGLGPEPLADASAACRLRAAS
jgi:formamidopyrimidine-DNA glycosylase